MSDEANNAHLWTPRNIQPTLRCARKTIQARINLNKITNGTRKYNHRRANYWARVYHRWKSKMVSAIDLNPTITEKKPCQKRNQKP